MQRSRLAGKSLADVLQLAEASCDGSQSIAAAAQRMNSLAVDLKGVMDLVAMVAEQSTASTEEMAAGSTEVDTSVQNIAKIAVENDLAARSVNASTAAVSDRIHAVSGSAQSLSTLADTLRDHVGRFTLDHTEDSGLS
jgi:methyl-accepting chemotaxis protein